jgi:hypothetical protein
MIKRRAMDPRHPGFCQKNLPGSIFETKFIGQPFITRHVEIKGSRIFRETLK